MPKPHTPPVFATAANTPSVKAGYELGGYEKTPPLFDEHQLETYAREAVRLNAQAVPCDCTTEIHADGTRKTWCGSDQMRRATEEGHAFAAAPQPVQANAKPMFWVRLCSDGCYEGPIHDSRIEDVRKQSGAWHPLYLAAPAAPQPRDDGMPASSDERHLRRLLASRVAMPNTYFDDGEAHGAEHGIQIDFMREPVAHIDAKLRALNVARLAVAAPQPAQQPLTDARFQKIRRSLMQQSGWDGDGWDQALKEAIEQAHRIGVKND